MTQYERTIRDTVFREQVVAKYVNFIDCTFLKEYDCSHCRFENCNFPTVCITFNSDHVNCRYGKAASTATVTKEIESNKEI